MYRQLIAKKEKIVRSCKTDSRITGDWQGQTCVFFHMFIKVITNTMLSLAIKFITSHRTLRGHLVLTLDPVAWKVSRAENDSSELLESRALLSCTNSKRGAGVVPPATSAFFHTLRLILIIQRQVKTHLLGISVLQHLPVPSCYEGERSYKCIPN